MLRTVLVNVMACMLVVPVFAQEKISVSGRVTDAQSEPLVGATVLVKGHKGDAVMTDLSGKYTISVRPDAELEFSYVGFKTMVVPVNNRSLINIAMEVDAMLLNEVVAIGYGSSRKEDLSMAVSTMKVDDIAKSRPQAVSYTHLTLPTTERV